MHPEGFHYIAKRGHDGGQDNRLCRRLLGQSIQIPLGKITLLVIDEAQLLLIQALVRPCQNVIFGISSQSRKYGIRGVVLSAQSSR